MAKVRKKKVWKIVGTPAGSRESYRLCFTSAPKTAMREYMKEGWKKSELSAIAVK